MKLTLELKPKSFIVPPHQFTWQDQKGLHADLIWNQFRKDPRETPVLRYMYKALDESSKDAHPN